MRTYNIYKVTNKINGKIYIGKTNNFNKRKTEHTVYDINDNSYFHKALKKYGLSNFEWLIIDKANSLEEINKKEKFYISKYNSFKPNGYNMTKGGDGGSMWNARPVVALDKEGDLVARYDSAGEAERIDGYTNSSVLVCCKNKNRTHKNMLFMFEDDYLQNGAYKYKKLTNNCEKVVIQYSKEGVKLNEFKSITEASSKTNTSRTSIVGVCRGSYKTANGYIWAYKGDSVNKENHMAKKRGRRILQIDTKTNNIVNEFESIADAGRFLNVNYKSIHKVLDLPNRKAYGFKWVTKEIYTNTEVK